MTQVNEKQIRKQFEKETGIPQSMIEEIGEAFPISYTAHIHTLTQTFNFRLTHGGMAKKGSFTEEK